MLQLCKSCIIYISIAGHRNKSNESHYPRDDSEIVADDTSVPAQEKLATCGYDSWLWPQICTKEKVTQCKL